MWQYRTLTLHVDLGNRVVTEEEGSAQVGELIVVWGVFTRESDIEEDTYIYRFLSGIQRMYRVAALLGTESMGSKLNISAPR